MAYEAENELKKLQMRDTGGIDGASTVQPDYANGSAAPITSARTGGYGENATGTAQRSYNENSGTAQQPGTKMKPSSPKKAAPKNSTPAAKSADAARGAYGKGTAKSPDEARGRDVGYNQNPVIYTRDGKRTTYIRNKPKTSSGSNRSNKK